MAAFNIFVFMVRAQNLLHWGHLLLNRFTRNMITAKNRNTGKQHQHPVGSAEKNPAAWIYGGAKLVLENGEVFAEHHIGAAGNILVHVMVGKWLPLQASLIRTEDFFEVRGFDAQLSVSEDKDLCRRIALVSNISQIPETVAAILRRQIHTSTNYKLKWEQNIRSRNRILGEKDAFSRLRLSADSSHWRGSMIHMYISCFRWNLHRRRLFKAMGQFVLGIAATLISVKYLLKRSFWLPILGPLLGKTDLKSRRQ